MKRQTVAVTLKSGATHYVLIQHSLEFMDMQDKLVTITDDEALKRNDKVKRGFATKFAASLCSPDGTLLLADIDAALAFMATIKMRDVYQLINAFNEGNALTDEAVEATEKK